MPRDGGWGRGATYRAVVGELWEQDCFAYQTQCSINSDAGLLQSLVGVSVDLPDVFDVVGERTSHRLAEKCAQQQRRRRERCL